MVVGRLAQLSAVSAVRRFTTTTARRSGALPPTELFPHTSLPVNINKKWKFTLIFAIFCSTGLNIPLAGIAYQEMKDTGKLPWSE